MITVIVEHIFFFFPYVLIIILKIFLSMHIVQVFFIRTFLLNIFSWNFFFYAIVYENFLFSTFNKVIEKGKNTIFLLLFKSLKLRRFFFWWKLTEQKKIPLLNQKSKKKKKKKEHLLRFLVTINENFVRVVFSSSYALLMFLSDSGGTKSEGYWIPIRVMHQLQGKGS